jgi:hypothetical protein
MSATLWGLKIALSDSFVSITFNSDDSSGNTDAFYILKLGKVLVVTVSFSEGS